MNTELSVIPVIPKISTIMTDSSLLKELEFCNQKRFNGKLEVRNSRGEKWGFYFCLGRIIWATGGKHLVRRWRRIFSLYCPQLELSNLKLGNSDLISSNCWEYRILNILNNRKQINTNQISLIVEDTIREVVFDVLQQEYNSLLSWQHDPNDALDVPLTLGSTDIFISLIQQIEKDWQAWIKLNESMTYISPNLAPILRQPEALKQKLEPQAYERFINFFNGKYTLRELAIKSKTDIKKLTASLLCYVQKNIVELTEIPDLAAPFYQNQPQSTPVSQQEIIKSRPLVACVDDSKQVAKVLEKLIRTSGFDFIAIHDPVKALLTLIDLKPDLIFLDVTMPIVNGYEICQQLRRSSLFNQTPIIFLTSNDSLVERMKAKMVGASDFLSKNIQAKGIKETLEKHLSGTSEATVSI